MLNEESETPASSSNKRLTRPPQNWTLKNAFGRSFFGDSSSHSGSNTNRASLTKPKGRLFGSHAVHISDVAVHRVGSNSEDVPQEPTRSQRNTTRFSISTKKDNHQRDSILNALKKTRVGQLSYNKSPDNYKSVLSPPRSSSEIGESASSSLYASKHSEFVGASPNGAVVVDNASGLVRFSKAKPPPKETASKSNDEARMEQWRNGMVSIRLDNEREKKALVKQLALDTDNKLALHHQNLPHKSSPTKVYGLTEDFDDTASEGDDLQEPSKNMRLDLSPIPQFHPMPIAPQPDKAYIPSVKERSATPTGTINHSDMAGSSRASLTMGTAAPSASLMGNPPPYMDNSTKPPSAVSPLSRLPNRASASLFSPESHVVSSTPHSPPSVADSSAMLPPPAAASQSASVVAEPPKEASPPKRASPSSRSPQSSTTNITERLCTEMTSACQRLREGLSLVENESVRMMQMDVLAQIERKLGANPDMNTIAKLTDTLAKLSTTIDRLVAVKTPSPIPPEPSSASTRRSVDRVPEQQEPTTKSSKADVSRSEVSSSAPQKVTEAAATGAVERPAAPSSPRERFAEYTAYLQSVEAETREFADTKRVDILRAELKRTIKDKINVMSKKMATRQEVKATFDYLHRLLSGETVADHQGTPLNLKGKHIATQWTITFIIDTYLALVNADASIVFVAAAVLAGLMLEATAFRRLLVAKIARASTLLNLDAAKCAEEALQVTLKGADAKNAWMSRECALVRLFVAVHATHDAPNGGGRPLPDGPPILWRLFADLLNFPPAPIASATVMHELITTGGWLLNDLYGQQFRKLLQCAKTQLLPKFDRSQTRLGEAAAVVTLEITLSKGIPKKPDGFYRST